LNFTQLWTTPATQMISWDKLRKYSLFISNRMTNFILILHIYIQLTQQHFTFLSYFNLSFHFFTVCRHSGFRALVIKVTHKSVTVRKNSAHFSFDELYLELRSVSSVCKKSEIFIERMCSMQISTSLKKNHIVSMRANINRIDVIRIVVIKKVSGFRCWVHSSNLAGFSYILWKYVI